MNTGKKKKTPLLNAGFAPVVKPSPASAAGDISRARVDLILKKRRAEKKGK